MGLLVPLYLAGLAALSLPVIFHLVRRTPRGRQDFSSLMFLAPSSPRLTRRSRLDQLCLLALRLAALGLLALAFARPFLRESASLAASSVPGRRVAILIDTSASMRRTDLWSQAVRLADKELDELNPQDDVALFAFSDRLQRVLDFEQDGEGSVAPRLQVARSRLHALAPGWGATDLGSGLITVAGEMDSTTDVRQSSLEPALVVISDFQKGSRIEALQAFEWPKRVPVVAKKVSPAKSTNAFAVVIAGEEDYDATDVRVRVASAADSIADQFYLAWSSEAAKLPKSQEVAVYVPPGQSRVVRLPRTAETLNADRIVLSGDDHVFDNTYYAVPPRKQNAAILYVGNDKVDDPQGLQYYLRLAVANDPLRQIEVRNVELGKAAAVFEDPHLRLVVASQAVKADMRPALGSLVERGGTLLCVPTDRETAVSLFSYFDDVELATDTNRAVSEYLLLGAIDFTHPLFAPFAGPRYGDFTKIHFWKHRHVVLKTPGDTAVVARFDNGDPAVLVRGLGKGRVYALTSGWQPDDSQLALSSKFVSLIAALVDQACGDAHGSPSVSVHDAVALPAASGREAYAVQISGAAETGRKQSEGQQIGLPAGFSSFSQTDTPGIYTARAGGLEWPFAVNLAVAESNTAPLEFEQLEQLGVRMGVGLSRAERTERIRQQRDTELENSQKVWRWLIVAAVGLLIVETWWAGRVERRIV
jgi:Mg-chelatase subunit ChlD